LKQLNISLVAGARPNFTKVAPVYHELAARVDGVRARGVELRLSIIHIGQHYVENMSDVFFRELGIPAPDRYLEVGSGSHADQTAKIMVRIESGKFVPTGTVRDFCAGAKRYAVLTLHRPSNVDAKETLAPCGKRSPRSLAGSPSSSPCIRARGKIAEFGPGDTGVVMVDPVGYLDMLYAVKESAMVLTDSGGLQEETTVLGVPYVTIRENTERPVTVTMGTNYLAGTNPGAILAAAGEILSGKAKKGRVPPLWDGEAPERIADILLQNLKMMFYPMEGL
jgi:UDP-N-acetylglucosamine 2-epimerase